MRSRSVSYTCAHPPAERARIVPVPQGRPCCTTTWAALPVTTVRRQVMRVAARQTCRGSQDAPVRPLTTRRATWDLVRWPRTNAVPARTSLPQRPPRRASCAAFGNVFDAASTSFITGTDTAIDLYIENTTYYYNWDGGDHHLQTRILGEFAQINLDGPDPSRRGTNAPPHETTFKFQFKRRDTGQPVSIPWMQFTFFDFDENVLTDWLVNNAGAKQGDGREARSLH